MSTWDAIVQMHRHADWGLLTAFYGGVVAIVIFFVLQVMRTRQGVKARKAHVKVAALASELEALRQEVWETENRIGERLSERVRTVEANGLQVVGEVEKVRLRIEQIDESIPDLYDELKEFRATLSEVFRNELGAVLNSFDNSLGAVLNHMKADLHMGISRIEGIENMVKNRQWAEQALLPLAAEGAEAQAPEAEHELPAGDTADVACAPQETLAEDAREWEGGADLSDEASACERDVPVSPAAGEGAEAASALEDLTASSDNHFDEKAFEWETPKAAEEPDTDLLAVPEDEPQASGTGQQGDDLDDDIRNAAA